jgi:integrase
MPKRSTDAPIYRRGDSPYWWTWVYEGGKRVRVSTKCTDRKAALAAATALQRAAQDPASRFAHETVSDALAAWIEQPAEWAENTVEHYGQRSMQVNAAMGDVRICDLTREHVEEYVKTRLAAGASPVTVWSERRCLVAALRHAKMRGRAAPELEPLVVRVPGWRRTRGRWLTEDEVEKLCSELTPARALWVRVAVYTGARKEEINALQWEDIDWQAGTIAIAGTKTKKSARQIPLAAPLRALLEPIQQPDGPLVVRWACPSTWLWRVCERAGIPRCSPHDFRRTFASWLLQRGVSERHIADLLGQEGTELVRKVYGHLDLDSLRGAIAKL